MGYIRITTNDGVAPENAGDKELINGTYAQRVVVSGGEVEIQLDAVAASKDTLTITYTATAPATAPSDADLYDAWEPVLVSSQGSDCSVFNAPTIQSSAGDIIYPAAAIS